MSPKVLEFSPYVFWFHSYDAQFENRASIHIGRSSQDDENDAKVWLEPQIELGVCKMSDKVPGTFCPSE